MLFGNTIRETFAAFSKPKKGDGEFLSAGSTANKREPISKFEAVARFIIAAIFLIIAGYLFYLDNKSQTAMAIMGFVAGYWLK